MEKLFIKNRKEQNISVLVEKSREDAPLAFVMHGLGGNKEQPHIRLSAETFLENGFTVVRFDTVHTYGESGGNPEDETVTVDFADLEDVILWAKTQPWYKQPFFLAGHSLGGMCTALYAERFPEQVAGLAPISTVVSGALSMKTEKYSSNLLHEWEKAGMRITQSESTPGLMKRLKWSHMEDRMRYNLLAEAKKLTMPVLLIVGEFDDSTSPAHQKTFFDVLPGPKEMHVISGAPHTFREPKHLQEIKQILCNWIKKYQ